MRRPLLLATLLSLVASCSDEGDGTASGAGGSTSGSGSGGADAGASTTSTATTGPTSTSTSTSTSTTNSSSASTGSGGGEPGGGGGTASAGGGGASSGSGGAGPATCPGSDVSVEVGEEVERTGNTIGAPDDHWSCNGANTGEIAYRVEPQDAGVLRVSLDGVGDYLPLLYGRRAACEDGEEIGCLTPAGSCPAILQLEAEAQSSYWFFADGPEENEGPYVMRFELHDVAPGDTCPGLGPVEAPQDGFLEVCGSTVGAVDDFASEGCATEGADVVHAVTATASGVLYLGLASEFDGVLSVRSTCVEQATELGCASDEDASGTEIVQVEVTEGDTVSVSIDSASGDEGNYTLLITLDPM